MVKYQIMQVKDVENCDYAFRGYKGAQFNIEDYEVVYEGEIEEYNIEYALENLFERFNIPTLQPKDYAGRSMSVSDVVVIIDGQYTTRYYCDIVGWIKIK